jgi:hypothetical protein
MDGNSFRNLIEAYSEVYTQVDENLLGSLDKTARETAGKVGGVLGREKAGKMPGANVPILGDVIKNEGERRGRAQGQGMYDKAKETIGGLLNQDYEYDTFDIILEYLITEGYADTNKAAIAIMANMSEEWRQSIVEQRAYMTVDGQTLRDYNNDNKTKSQIDREKRMSDFANKRGKILQGV